MDDTKYSFDASSASGQKQFGLEQRGFFTSGTSKSSSIFVVSSPSPSQLDNSLEDLLALINANQVSRQTKKDGGRLTRHLEIEDIQTSLLVSFWDRPARCLHNHSGTKPRTCGSLISKVREALYPIYTRTSDIQCTKNSCHIVSIYQSRKKDSSYLFLEQYISLLWNRGPLASKLGQ